MKKIVLFITALMMTVAAQAQFEQGKAYLGATLSGLDLSYNGMQKGRFILGGKVGYLFADDWMLSAQLGYEKQKDEPYRMSLGAGVRYYIVQNGLYLGASGIFKHAHEYNDFLPSVQLGYAFFLSRTVTIEPEFYYEQSFKSHSDYSTVGFRIGVGVYLFKDKTKN